MAIGIVAAIVFVWVEALISYKLFMGELGKEYKDQIFESTIQQGIFIFTLFAPMAMGIARGSKLIVGKLPG